MIELTKEEAKEVLEFIKDHPCCFAPKGTDKLEEETKDDSR
jgi:hypothetical protein